MEVAELKRIQPQMVLGEVVAQGFREFTIPLRSFSVFVIVSWGFYWVYFILGDGSGSLNMVEIESNPRLDVSVSSDGNVVKILNESTFSYRLDVYLFTLA